jgi:proton glutamate symport protein
MGFKPLTKTRNLASPMSRLVAGLRIMPKGRLPKRVLSVRGRFGLTAQIFLGFIIGGLIGWLWPEVGVQLKPLSVLFLRLIKMLIAPLLFSTLVVGIAGSAGHHGLGRLGLKTFIYFEIVTTLALVIGLLVGNVTQPGTGLAMTMGHAHQSDLAQITENASHLQSHSFVDTLIHMVPENAISALAQVGDADILQIVVFSFLFALALIAAGSKGKPILQGLESLSEVMFKLVGIVMMVAPLGVLGAMANAIGTNGVDVLWVYAKLVGSLYLALGLFVVVVLLVVCKFARIPMGKLIAAIKEPFILAFSTASSESALPKAMKVMEQFGVPKSIVAFVLPTGYSFNLDGSTLYLALATLFVAQVAGVHLPLTQQVLIMLTLMVTSKGVAAVPRASLVVLAGTLSAFNLPLEGIGVILGIDHVLDMGRTSVNLLGNCVASAVIARSENCLDDEKMLNFIPEGEEPLPVNQVQHS